MSQNPLWESVVPIRTVLPSQSSSSDKAGGGVGGPLKRSSSVHHARSGSTASSIGVGPQGSHGLHERRRSISAERALRGPAPTRTKERFIPLPLTHPEEDGLGEAEEEADGELQPLLLGHGQEPSPGSPLPASQPHHHGTKGRIMVVTACEAFNREQTFSSLQQAYPHLHVRKFPEVIYVEAWLDPALTGVSTSTDAPQPADVFVFDYGVVICWGMSRKMEQDILKVLSPCQVKPLDPKSVHTDELTFHYTADQPPHIQNDCITISRREACDHSVKMAISHALAQSSKLDLYEARVGSLVEQVRHLPESLAMHGEVKMSRQQMAQIKGQVFIQKSEVYLLSTVLDTPDFFWEAPDALRALYDKVCEYCALDDRVALVNSRIMLIQSMLRIWSDHKSHNHLARLDNIIIILIVIEVIIAAAEVVGFFWHPTGPL